MEEKESEQESDRSAVGIKGETFERTCSEDEEDDEDTDLVDLPPELCELKDKTYDYPDDLEKDLKGLDLADLNVVIDPTTRKARLRMTKGSHDTITELYSCNFNEEWTRIVGQLQLVLRISTSKPNQAVAQHIASRILRFGGTTNVPNPSDEGRWSRKNWILNPQESRMSRSIKMLSLCSAGGTKWGTQYRR